MSSQIFGVNTIYMVNGLYLIYIVYIEVEYCFPRNPIYIFQDFYVYMYVYIVVLPCLGGRAFCASVFGSQGLRFKFRERWSS